MPCTAQTTGFHTFCHFGLSSSPGSSWFQTSSGWPYAFLTSSPAQNARSPAARSTTALTAGSSLIRCQAARISSHICAVEGVERVGPIERDRRDAVRRRLVADRRVGRAHRHFQSGARFSTKARGPSFASSVRTHALAEGLGEDLRLVQRQVEALADREARAADGERRVAVDERRDLARALEQPVVRDDLGHQAELVGALRAEPLVAAGQRDAHRDVERQHAGEAHHLAARHEADAHVRVEELGALGRDRRCRRSSPGRGPAPQQRPLTAVRIGLGHRPERRRGLLRRLPLRVASRGRARRR